MPAFPRAPEVFPPIVPATRAGGDLPMFAFRRRGSVVAWSQPDGFAAREEVRLVRLEWADGEHLSVNVYYVWEPDEEARRAKVEAAVQAQAQRLREAPEKMARSNMPLQDYVVELDEWLEMPAEDGPARVLRYRAAFIDKQRGRVGRHLEFAYFARGVSPGVAVVAELESRRRGRAAVPATELLARWRRCLVARGPTVQGPDLACWLDVFGFVTEDAHKVVVDCISGWETPLEPGEFRFGEDVRAWILPPVDRSRFDLDFEMRETMRQVKCDVGESPSISVTSRDVPVTGLELPVFASYEVEAVPGPLPDEPWDDEYEHQPFDALGRPANWNPGRRIRTIFILLDDDTVVGLRMNIGGRLYDRIEAFWAAVCARCWLWREDR
ncbi:MAG: hypothetical protein U0168_12255 [Nannocystaceae bacterium]